MPRGVDPLGIGVHTWGAVWVWNMDMKARELGRALMCLNKGRHGCKCWWRCEGSELICRRELHTLAKGTPSIESASRAEKAAAAQPKVLGMTRPTWNGTERCQPSATRLLWTAATQRGQAHGRVTAMKGWDQSQCTVAKEPKWGQTGEKVVKLKRGVQGQQEWCGGHWYPQQNTPGWENQLGSTATRK